MLWVGLCIGFSIGLATMALVAEHHKQQRLDAMLKVFGDEALDAACDKFIDTCLTEQSPADDAIDSFVRECCNEYDPGKGGRDG